MSAYASDAIAGRRAKNRTLTAAVTFTTSKRPVFIGDVVSCYAEIEKAGRTSITVRIESWARRWISDEA